MKSSQQNTLVKYINTIPDPRYETMCWHNFIDILVIAICAVFCGVETWEGMAEFGRRKQAWLSTFIELPHGIPSHDTFYRLFCLLNPEVFEECFTRWISDTLRQFTGDGLDIIPIDGKCLRGSRSRSKKAIHLVSAWSVRSGIVPEAKKWQGLHQVGMIQRDRQIDNIVTTEVHYYIMSQQNSAAELLDVARKHWEVENKLHWRLDVSFHEDQNKTTDSNAIENLSILNRLCLNVHTQDKTTKGSIMLKRQAAGWNDQKLGQLLSTIVQI